MDAKKSRTTHRTIEVLWAIGKTGGGASCQQLHWFLRSKRRQNTLPVKDIRMSVLRLISLGLAKPSANGNDAEWHPFLTGRGHKTFDTCFQDPSLINPLADGFRDTWINDLVFRIVKQCGPEIEAGTVAEILGLSQTTVCAALKSAIETGHVRTVGQGKATRYREVITKIPFSPTDEDLSSVKTMDFPQTGNGRSETGNFQESPVTVAIEIDAATMKRVFLLASLAEVPMETMLSKLIHEWTERMFKNAKGVFTPPSATLKENRK